MSSICFLVTFCILQSAWDKILILKIQNCNQNQNQNYRLEIGFKSTLEFSFGVLLNAR